MCRLFGFISFGLRLCSHITSQTSTTILAALYFCSRNFFFFSHSLFVRPYSDLFISSYCLFSRSFHFICGGKKNVYTIFIGRSVGLTGRNIHCQNRQFTANFSRCLLKCIEHTHTCTLILSLTREEYNLKWMRGIVSVCIYENTPRVSCDELGVWKPFPLPLN